MQLPVTSLAWLEEQTIKGRYQIHSQMVSMTPEVAKVILSQNPENRPITTKIQSIAEDILNDRWVFNGETIIISQEGCLNDGQHRMEACVIANKPIDVTVIFGLPRASRFSVDQGVARTVASQLAIRSIPNAAMVAAIARRVIQYESGDGSGFRAHRSISGGMIQNRCMFDPDMAESATFAATQAPYIVGRCIPSVIGTAHYLLSKVNHEKAVAYMTQVCRGENIQVGDPAYAVRYALDRHKSKSHAISLEIILRGWVAYCRGSKLTTAKVLGSFPAIT
jgi:hypothetical protein